MLSGKVKWFNADFGYGFIQLGRGQNDVFVHYSVIQTEGYRTLRQGQKVGFEVARGPKGDHATIVVVEGEGGSDDSRPATDGRSVEPVRCREESVAPVAAGSA